MSTGSASGTAAAAHRNTLCPDHAQEFEAFFKTTASAFPAAMLQRPAP